MNSIADLGTGSGVIALILSRTYQTATVCGIESNRAMAALAADNVSLNLLSARIRIAADDILNHKAISPVSSFDLVVSNPPFRSAAHGKVSPVKGRDTARHESSAGMADFLAAAKYLVKPSGRICFVYHPSRLAEFIHTASLLKLALLRLRIVHGTIAAPATIFLAELAKARKGSTSILPPLIVYEPDGHYTPEAARILGQEQ